MTTRILVLAACLVAGALAADDPRIEAPRFWNDCELADWATPIAALGVRPGHFSEREYYSAPPAEWVRTYPAYAPGREPAGYREMLEKRAPEPLIAPGARTAREWVAEGARVFEEMDVPVFRSTNPKLIAVMRSAEAFARMGGRARPDGTVFGLRWAPTSKGLALTLGDCSSCHTRLMPDGTLLRGAPFNEPLNGVIGTLAFRGLSEFFPGDSQSVQYWRQYGVPWIPGDIHERIKTMSPGDIGTLDGSVPPGVFARFNGSPYFPTKVPDLIGIKDRAYIDATGTHRLRGPADVMRYAALVSCCDSAEFGSHQVLGPAQRRIQYRMSDEALFAMAEYLFALTPPPNPNAGDRRAAAGQKVFERERCSVCHTPPLFTNNKLTLAQGFAPPDDHPERDRIVRASVGTDPGLAMKTRKGTGFYKVPSLRGVWYRGLYGHDGSVASLEDWFDAGRLRDDYVRSGFKGAFVTLRAVPGHEYGLKLSAEDKAALIAFLKTL
jgi:mono/diheme cytochrome c family protein